MTDFKVDKTKLVDKMGRGLTQSLFLEIDYNADVAVYTLGEFDKTYKGKVYPSLKRLFLEHEDPIEHNFAVTYLLGWKHWQKLNGNKQLRAHFDEWRYELEVAIRSAAVSGIIDQSSSETGFQACKWLADRGWEKRGAGRPSKQDIEKEAAVQKAVEDEFSVDIKRMSKVNGSLVKNSVQKH